MVKHYKSDGTYTIEEDVVVSLSNEQINYSKLLELKQKLAEWDYKGQKYLDGEYTEEEWAEIVAQRKEWRQEIRELEKELQELKEE